ncbi:MAG: hypothetical protein ACRDRL_31700, partial [Sciscionella sp.]
NKDLFGQVQAADDRATSPEIVARMRAADKMIGSMPSAVAATRNGQVPMTLTNVSQMMAQMYAKNPSTGWSPQMIDTLSRNEGLQTQLGIVPPATSLKAAQGAAVEQAKAPITEEINRKSAEATAAAQAKYRTPSTSQFTDDQGNRNLVMTFPGGAVRTINLGKEGGKFDMGGFRGALALRSAGKTSANAQVDQLTPSEAKTVQDNLGKSSDLQALISAFTGGGAGAGSEGDGGAGGGGSATPPAAAPKYTAANPAKPATQADFDKLQSGDVYINPKDGKPYTKK